MKRLITIILALIMTLFTVPNQGADQPLVNAVKTSQTAITTQVKQVPEESETTAETALVDDVSETETESETEETAVSKNEATLTEAEVSIIETTVDQETLKEESAEIREETLTTEGLHINSHTITNLDIVDLGANSLNDANHLVTDRNAWHRTRHTAVLNMQIAGANTAKRNAHNGISRVLQLGFWLVD